MTSGDTIMTFAIVNVFIHVKSVGDVKEFDLRGVTFRGMHVDEFRAILAEFGNRIPGWAHHAAAILN
jgi:hypothetical protein